MQRTLNRPLFLSSIVVVAAAALACGRTPAPAVPAKDAPSMQPAAVHPAAAAAAAAAESSPERALCLAEVKGDSAVEKLIKDGQRAIASNPLKMDFWIVLGRAWIEEARNTGDPGFYLHADACAQEVLKHEPDSKSAHNLRGLALMNDHKFAEAKELMQKMLDKDHEDVMAWGTLSDALLELGDVDGSAKALQEMMNRKPNMPSYARASYLDWLRGDEKGALEAIRLAIDAGRGQRDPEPEAWTLTEAANIFWMRGDVPGSLAGYDRALQTKADHGPALVGKARCLIAQGKAADAVPLLEQAFKKTPLVETAWWLSKAHEVLGDAVKADEWRKRAIDAGKEGDRRTLALLLATVSSDPADVALAQKSIDADNAHRGGPYADDVAALVAYRAADLALARKKIDAAMALGTPDPRFALHKGVIVAAAGDKKAGKKLIDDALARGLRFDPDAVALAKEALATGGPAKEMHK